MSIFRPSHREGGPPSRPGSPAGAHRSFRGFICCFARFATKAEFSGVLSTSRTIGFSPNSSFLNLPVPRLAIDGKVISPTSRNMGFLRFGILHLYEALPVIRFTMRAIQPTSSGMPRPALRLAQIEGKQGAVTAARARSALSAMFNWAIREGFELATNPVFGTNRPAEPKSRTRVLTDVELAAVWRACRDDDHGRIVRLLMLLGQRRDEVGGMRWNEVDFDHSRSPDQKPSGAHDTVAAPRPDQSIPSTFGFRLWRGCSKGLFGLEQIQDRARCARDPATLAIARSPPNRCHRACEPWGAASCNRSRAEPR
jgi:hypothetical protein